jgi:hypothetical protein
MVVTCRPCTITTGITQVRTAALSQTPMPQPNLLPVSRRSSRTTHRSGTSLGPSNSADAPLTSRASGSASHAFARKASSGNEAAAGRGGERLRDGGSDRRQRHLWSRLRLTCPVNERAVRDGGVEHAREILQPALGDGMRSTAGKHKSFWLRLANS